ncbi:nucleolar protein 14 homolog [Epargyreus clarus]|uniref:nucleolar protein 14 homolog n=1 Tax=Epargyreus clarus TaxID=520877 RepID=UPI003C2F2738
MAKVKNKRNAGLADKVQAKKRAGVDKKKVNPFEVHINREKLKVLGKKSKHDRGLPGVSRAKAVQKRKETLGTEMKLMNKTNAFIDRRIGEKNNQLSAEDRMVARFAAERARQHTKKNIYNLADDEILTHRGQTLEQIEKFDDPRSSDDEDEGKKFGGLDNDFVSEGHFGGGMLSKSESKDGAKSHKDLIEQLIAESKKRKAEKQKEKEQTLDLTEKLDSEWKDLQPVVFKKQRVEEESLIDKLLAREEKGQDYDKMMRELRFEKRGTPSDGLKNTEKQREEDRKKLEELEKQLQQRMLPDNDVATVVQPKKHRSADDLDDNFELDNDQEFMLAYDKDGKPLVPDHILKDYSVPNSKKQFNDGISDTSSEDGDDEDEDDEENEESDGESGEDIEDKTSEPNSEANDTDNDSEDSNKKDTKIKKGKDNIQKDIKSSRENKKDKESSNDSDDDSSNESSDKDTVKQTDSKQKADTKVTNNDDKDSSEEESDDNNDKSKVNGILSKTNTNTEAADLENMDDSENSDEESSDDNDDKSDVKDDFKDLRESEPESDEGEDSTEDIKSFFNLKTEEGDNLKKLLEGKSPSQQSTALQKLIKSYDPSLSQNNKDLLSRLFAHLLQYVNDIFSNLDSEADVIKSFLIFDKIVPHFYDLVHLNKVSTKKYINELLKEKHDAYKRRPKLVPNLDTLVFFKLISLLYPTSDFRHPVTTPTFVFMSEILTLSRFSDRYAISRGLLVTALILEYTVLSKRFVPPAVNFLRGVIYLCANTSILNPIQVVPPFKLHKDMKILNIDNDCSKLVVENKMLAKDLVCKEIDDDFKIRCLLTSTLMLKEFFDNYTDIEAQAAIFEPHIHLLGRVDLDLYPSKVRDKVSEVLKYMKQCLEMKTYTPMAREKVRPKALRLYEPDIQEVFTGSKTAKLSKESAERARLQGKYKKEMKGALREIRRDKAYIASVKIKQKIQSDTIRKEKVKQIYKEASIQQGELNKLKRMK